MSAYKHKYTPPDEVEGTAVKYTPHAFATRDGAWLTLVPKDPEDDRLWEFDVDSGRLLRTR